MIAENQAVLDVDNHARLKTLAWHFLPPGVYFFFLLRWYPYWNNIWIYSDEGFNLMKALLVSRGFSLYSQVWSDQAPLLTEMLALLYRIRGPGVYASRLLVLIFSCVLVWALVQFLRLAWGDHAAFAGVFLIILLPTFMPLSAAVLVGQPSLAMAAVSLLALAAWHRRRMQVFLIFSALALAASVLIKLFTAFLAPVFLVGLLAAEAFAAGGASSLWAKIRPAVVWLAVFASSTLLVGIFLAGQESLPQLLGTPWAASQATEYPPNEQIFPITHYLRDAWAVLFLAGIGTLFVFQQRRWLMLYPLVWGIVAFVSLFNLKPVWFHHQLLVTLPAALLAAGAAAETARLASEAIRQRSAVPRSSGGGLMMASGLIAVALVVLTLVPSTVQFLRSRPIPTEERNAFEDKVLNKIEQYADQTNWMLADLPMYAFKMGKLVPPELAVISWKRLTAGNLSQEEILEIVKKYQPEQILLGRFEFPILDSYLAENYRLVLEREGELVLYVRNDIVR